MLSLDEGKKAVQFARKIIESYVKNQQISSDEKQGVFVTIHTYPNNNLRGCIGIPQPVMILKNAIVDVAKSATRDPRFPPLSEKELDNIIIEVTILTKPELINVTQPKEYPSQIKIGRDGLIVEYGIFRGLLLPQVPVEQEWNKEEFLSQTCMKAGLMPDSWFDKETKIYKFSGQIFTETQPNGEVKEKEIDGTDH